MRKLDSVCVEDQSNTAFVGIAIPALATAFDVMSPGNRGVALLASVHGAAAVLVLAWTLATDPALKSTRPLSPRASHPRLTRRALRAAALLTALLASFGRLITYPNSISTVVMLLALAALLASAAASSIRGVVRARTT
jgi:hypothetical protein